MGGGPYSKGFLAWTRILGTPQIAVRQSNSNPFVLLQVRVRVQQYQRVNKSPLDQCVPCLIARAILQFSSVNLFVLHSLSCSFSPSLNIFLLPKTQPFSLAQNIKSNMNQQYFVHILLLCQLLFRQSFYIIYLYIFCLSVYLFVCLCLSVSLYLISKLLRSYGQVVHVFLYLYIFKSNIYCVPVAQDGAGVKFVC